MIVHLTLEQCERFTQFALTPEELLDADEHLASCAQCRDQIASRLPVTAQIAELQAGLDAAAQAPGHLSFELVSRYLDNRLGNVDQEAVGSHLALCAMCVAELDDLRTFRAELSTYPARNFTPTPQPGFFDKIALWRRRVRFAAALGAASAVAGIALVTMSLHGGAPNTAPPGILPSPMVHVGSSQDGFRPSSPSHPRPASRKPGTPKRNRRAAAHAKIDNRERNSGRPEGP